MENLNLQATNTWSNIEYMKWNSWEFWYFLTWFGRCIKNIWTFNFENEKLAKVYRIYFL